MNLTIGSIRIRAKNAINSSKKKATFFSTGNIRTISPNKNDTNDIINNDDAMIVIVVILFNFFIVNNCLIYSQLNKLLECKLRH